ncbi:MULTISPECIES: branched-chain amino acid ABC transporter permease [unclassified Beijerinckia]|uniref:branched-chain amino acid ABC transporter permease n=1 Tax=unclassified Beijerinckia TaxID=2638183 RepID=UPI000895776A|nr:MULTISPECIES: branched-chain amino acid ABC transporter permease [unclassified Beijerinckia]MDH7799269.1 branched-chain amino acid transport system permease protein [Beijerinckia sp. GAS462]SED90121.1 amino acid/amide ABC transporter membrane protein 1, HAAT family [Beijerinckia sp. 28-YEA-48]
MAEFFMVVIGGAKIGAIYALAALGVVVIHKATKVVNFAHGGLVLLGAVGAYIVVVALEWNYAFAYLLVPPAVGLCAVALELIVLRTLRRADLYTVVIATIFLGIALSEGVRLSHRAEILAVPAVFSPIPLIFDGVIIMPEQIWVICGVLAAAAAGIVLFQYGRIGRSMRAMASNIRGAQLCGYSIEGVYALAWFFGGTLAGLAGVFTAPVKGVTPELAVSTVAAAFVAAVIGGFDSLIGAILGGLLLGISETLAAAYVSSATKSATSFILLFAVLMIRPQGLFAGGRVRNV